MRLLPRGIAVQRGVRPSNELVQVEGGQDLEPSLIDRTGARTARDIAEDFVDRVRTEQHAGIFQLVPLPAPITGEDIARVEIARVRRRGRIVRRLLGRCRAAERQT
jgi:hypothetical protein